MARAARVLLVAAAVWTGSCAGTAAAQDDVRERVDPEELPERAVPDYEGRGEAAPGAGEALLWVPRVILSPLYFASEYLLRRPLGAVVSYAEQKGLPALLVDFFTFGPDRKAGIVPTALFDFGFRPSVGFYAFGDDFLFDDNDLRVHGATWGANWLSLTATDRLWAVPDRVQLAARFDFERRTDWLFYGLGPLSPEQNESRYQQTRVEAGVVVEGSRLWRTSSARVEIGVRRVGFESESCCSDPPIGQVFDELPPGFESGYDIYTNRLVLALDTRRRRPGPGDGVRLELRGEHAVDLREPLARRWMRYGGSLGIYWDPGGHNRVVGLTGTVLFVDPLGEREVPFTEQVVLGGTRHMRGFIEGRLVGRSAAMATFEYRWPVWIWLDGTLHAAVGNVFGPHLEALSPERLRASFGMGFRTSSSRDHSFDLLLGLGTEPFDRFAVTSVRILVGATRGF